MEQYLDLLKEIKTQGYQERGQNGYWDDQYFWPPNEIQFTRWLSTCDY